MSSPCFILFLPLTNILSILILRPELGKMQMVAGSGPWGACQLPFEIAMKIG